jgi:hypothetical protein
MLLYNQVQKLPFRDHNAPPLLVLVGFCKQATAWLNENPANIVSVSAKLLMNVLAAEALWDFKIDCVHCGSVSSNFKIENIWN